jgi:hypothetical protein
VMSAACHPHFTMTPETAWASADPNPTEPMTIPLARA